MTEILVNTTTTGFQHHPAVARLGGTHSFVVWTDSSSASIKAQLFLANGTKSGGEFVVNDPAPVGGNIERVFPAVANTGFGPVVAWIERPFDSAPRVKVQRFNNSAEKVGSEIQVSTEPVEPDNRLAVIGLTDGGFLVTWVDPRPDQRVRAQRFHFDGTKAGSESLVSATEGFHRNPLAAPLENGAYVIGWRSDPSAPGGGTLVFRIRDLAGSTGLEITPNLSGFGSGAMALLDSGNFVVVHVRSLGNSNIGVEKSVVEAHVYAPDGTFTDISVGVSAGSGINCSWPSVTGLPGGRFVVAWVQKSAETFSTQPSVRAKLLSESQGSIGQEIQVNTTTAGDRFGTRVAALFGPGDPETAFVVWTDDSGTGGDDSEFAVHARALPIQPGGF
ncbi:hypothetical protein [Nocardia aurea]|uniref:hypothetical protein n=1 Tax=Nocardia aurea TaxID=2144174 RepID=UPI000D6870D9|nr:hypothetical protein [Nocardia aurea]